MSLSLKDTVRQLGGRFLSQLDSQLLVIFLRKSFMRLAIIMTNIYYFPIQRLRGKCTSED